MRFDQAITTSPTPYDATRASEAEAASAELPDALKSLIKGAAGCSPYLLSLVQKEAAWLPKLCTDPEQVFSDILTQLTADDTKPLDQRLRQAKRRVALLTALADLGGVWTLETVTDHLTQFADCAVDLALRDGIACQVRTKKLDARFLMDAPVVALAMGKMGAYELNYSSDIDLICLFDETQIAAEDVGDVRSGLVRAVRHMTKLLSDITAEGYVFRTDLRLRPDASVTPVVLPMITAERYYESVGRTWERAAYIKARPAAGDLEAGARFLETLRPFVWRRHLDFAAIQDAHDMRLKIREHKGLHGPITLPGHDMKLGRGGIREIEFFTQTRQLTSGGRDPSLRVRDTVGGLDRLAEAGWITRDVADRLIDHYRAHRTIEHRLQMIADQQTHALPSTDEGFDQLAAFMSVSTAELRSELKERLEEVYELTETFFAPRTAPAKLIEPAFGDEVSTRWPKYPALRTARAGAIFERLRPDILNRLQRAARPDEALAAFDEFLSGLPAGVQLFSLFEANPQLIDLIVDISATSAPLARYLSRNASVFDAVIGGRFFAPWPGVEHLTAALAARLEAEGDYERQLDAARSWHKDWHFRIGVHFLRGIVSEAEASAHYSDLATAVLAALWPVTQTEFSEKHGRPPGRGATVLGMGSLGAGQLTATSDLDLIVVYDGQGVDSSDGPRPLETPTYYARLTQAFITALTVQTAEGALYETDMRLRPSGRHGPVATSWSAFQSYQQDQAWTWEHLALTRARSVAGAVGLGRDVMTFRRKLLAGHGRATQDILSDVREMRARIADAKTGGGVWDLKTRPGALQDSELLAQTAALLAGSDARKVEDQLNAGVALGWLSVADCADLMQSYRLFRAVQGVLRLVDAAQPGQAALGLLQRETGLDAATLETRLISHAAQSAEMIERALAKAPEGKGQ
jgi:glutamate-ammonia-ligase adenylyltransferase